MLKLEGKKWINQALCSFPFVCINACRHDMMHMTQQEKDIAMSSDLFKKKTPTFKFELNTAVCVAIQTG